MEETRLITDPTELIEFIVNCKELGYNNNSSLLAMKFNWVIENNGIWTGTFKEDRLISVSAIHPFENGWRALFRGAQIEARNVLSKYHFSSHCFYNQLPVQLQYAKSDPVFITTNVDHDASGKMKKINKVFYYLEKQNLLTHVDQKIIFTKLQNLWLVNRDQYLNVRYG